jgi:hypothetical protein
MHWHVRFDADRAQCWLRNTIHDSHANGAAD